MKSVCLLPSCLLAAALYAAIGCSAADAPPVSFEIPAATSPDVWSQKEAVVRDQPALESATLPPSVTHQSFEAGPDAVIVVERDKQSWTTQTDQSLAAIVAVALADKRNLIRLHGYSPISGSNSMSIALAEPALKAVRDRLHALGIAPGRIQIINYGHRYTKLRSSSGPWTEIFIVRSNKTRR